MQVPERLALIGGSILLASTLVFTLRSQASSILPKIAHPISSIYGHIGDTQKSVDFDGNFNQAQKNGETTGNWGSSKYYIGKDNDMHVGKGTLQGSLNHLLGNDEASKIQSLSIDQNVHAPQDSTALFSTAPLYNGGNSSLGTIDGLDNVDTSQTMNIISMFGGDYNLQSINGINSWDVSNVRATAMAFHGVSSMTDLDLSNWDLNNVNDASYMFGNNVSLKTLNLQNANLTGANMNGFFGGTAAWSATDDNLRQITLGNDTKLTNTGYEPANNWQNGNQNLTNAQLNDGSSHPGTWFKQYEPATNLSPITETDNWNGYSWIYPWSFHAEKGKTYYLSADFHNVTSSLGEFNSLQATGWNGNAALWDSHNVIPTGQSGTSVAKWTANQTGDVTFGFGHDTTDKITNINITQSDSYVPYDKTTQNHNNQ